ncbi:hypothetical protein TNCV_2946711, partial [Trichonephila clavipes]
IVRCSKGIECYLELLSDISVILVDLKEQELFLHQKKGFSLGRVVADVPGIGEEGGFTGDPFPYVSDRLV